MKVTIKATVPTRYQRQSICSFCLPVNEYPGGSLSICSHFKTKRAAVAHLLKVADILAENEEELREMKADIKKGRLSYDAATCYIEKFEQE